MVNVAGRSKGCENCKRRRVRCDERKTHGGCLRCERSKLVCEGYAKRRWQFIDQKAHIEHRIGKRTAATSTSPVPFTASSTDSLQVVKFGGETRCDLPRALDLGGFQDNIEITFTISRFTRTFPWFRYWLLDDPDPERSDALLALSKAYFGRAHKQKVIVDKGALCYVKALRQLNEHLQDPELMLHISALTNAMKLSMYEFISKQSTNWVYHSWGIAKLVETRGPEKCMNHLEIFDGQRFSIILLYLRARKRCFLERKEWQTIPWTLCPESKTMSAYLQDLIAYMPGLAEDLHILKTEVLSEEEREFRCRDLHNNISACVQGLYRWRIQWETKYPQACFEVDSVLAASPFLKTLYYSCFQRAIEITKYHMALLVLVSLTAPSTSLDGTPISIADSLVAYELDQTPLRGSNVDLSLPSKEIDARKIARDICRSAEYHFLQDHVESGSLLLLGPLRVAVAFLEVGDEKERSWAQGVLRQAATYAGFEGRDYITDDWVVNGAASRWVRVHAIEGVV